ncbi:hypothetical protein HGM15179_018628 [Zosterops borbonicus]|uniref:Uncharacterized protein n=1 Tax=Zosterops borbonicus TaxID=364589 RepID=A0A8K1DAS0_9PASS|nr:hypothetical protein HGM15179_018628 [Zosterops borbonicus]
MLQTYKASRVGTNMANAKADPGGMSKLEKYGVIDVPCIKGRVKVIIMHLNVYPKERKGKNVGIHKTESINDKMPKLVKTGHINVKTGHINIGFSEISSIPHLCPEGYPGEPKSQKKTHEYAI